MLLNWTHALGFDSHRLLVFMSGHHVDALFRISMLFQKKEVKSNIFIASAKGPDEPGILEPRRISMAYHNINTNTLPNAAAKIIPSARPHSM
jgi:hypothetical protein